MHLVALILALALVGAASFAVANGFANCNMMPILCLITDPRYRATGYGVLNMCGTVAGGFGFGTAAGGLSAGIGCVVGAGAGAGASAGFVMAV